MTVGQMTASGMRQNWSNWVGVVTEEGIGIPGGTLRYIGGGEDIVGAGLGAGGEGEGAGLRHG